MLLEKKPLAKIVAQALTALSISLTTPMIVMADDVTGVVRGSAVGAEGAVILVIDHDKGTTKKAVIGADENYRISSLPPGNYTVQIKAGETILDEQNVRVTLGGTTVLNFSADNDGNTPIEELTVTAGRISAVDPGLATSGIVISTEELNTLPVSRDLDSVTMLAPGVSRGDSAFGGTSFSGSSVAENVTYVNGLNITNFRNGLGFSKVPFEAYDTVQVKTGGYSAKYGRSTGGVVNSVVKSGSNEFDFGVNAYHNGQLDTVPNTYSQANNEDESSTNTVDLYASGALIEDRVFFYGLYSKEDHTSDSGFGITSGNGYINNRDADFWLTKLDVYLSDDHRVELLAFSDSRDTLQDKIEYDYSSKYRGDLIGTTTYTSGGTNYIASYVGQITDNLELNIAYGENNYTRKVTPDTATCPILQIFDEQGNRSNIGCWSTGQIEAGEDQRKMARVDLNIDLGSHYIQVGYDNEKNTAQSQTQYSGGIYYQMYKGNGDPDSFNNGNGYVSEIFYETAGSFEVHSEAFYIQDTWTITDSLEIEVGLRNDSFTNYNGSGEDFVTIDNQWAPRFSLSWDPIGDGRQTFFMNAGLYYLPVAANTSIRMAGNETYTKDYYQWDGNSQHADLTPVLGAHIQQDILSNGSVPDTRSTTDANIEAMYQSELILGYEWITDADWTFRIKGMYRNLERSLEDVAIDGAVIDHYNSTGTWDSNKVNGQSVEEVFGGFHQYVLTNPGNDMSIYIPEMDEYISLSPEQLGYPESQRKYTSIELSFERPFDDQWMLNGSYTWAHSWGNTEGYVKSDNGQDDAGITQDFDQPALTEGAYGDLPNDRRHTVKLFGAYEFDNGIALGVNTLFQTGRPVNCIGVHPTDPFAQQYESASFYCDGQLMPRGSQGRTENMTQVDLSVKYNLEFASEQSVQLSLDVFNIFNSTSAIEVDEQGELDSGADNPNYKKATGYQPAISYRLSARYNF